jgi:hypothetical protein
LTYFPHKTRMIHPFSAYFTLEPDNMITPSAASRFRPFNIRICLIINIIYPSQDTGGLQDLDLPAGDHYP